MIIAVDRYHSELQLEYQRGLADGRSDCRQIEAHCRDLQRQLDIVRQEFSKAKLQHAKEKQLNDSKRVIYITDCYDPY